MHKGQSPFYAQNSQTHYFTNSVQDLIQLSDSERIIKVENGSNKPSEIVRNNRFKINSSSHPPKYCVSSPEVNEDSKLQKSAIEELQFLDNSINTEQNNMITLKTLEGLGIRRSHSFDKQKIQLSLSSDYVDLQYENSNLKVKIVELGKEIQDLIEVEKATKSQLLFFKKKLQRCQDKTKRFQQQIGKLLQKIVQQEEIIQEKQKSMNQLQIQIQKLSNNQIQLAKLQQYQKEMDTFKAKIAENDNKMGQLIKDYENQLKLLKNQSQQKLIYLQQSFNRARVIGQQQINSLIKNVQQKEQIINQLKCKISHQLLDKKSTLISQNLSISKVNSKDRFTEVPIQSNYINRYFSFSKQIDRKLHQSSDQTLKLYGGISAKSIVGHINQQDQQDSLQVLCQHNNRLNVLLNRNKQINEQLLSVKEHYLFHR